MFRKTLSLFGYLALFVSLAWPLLRRQRWYLRLNVLASLCQWEWWRSSKPPAGHAMPCIKLLPLPPPCGSHWLVGGFQQCRVCVLSCCCSLSVAWCLQCRVLAWYWFLLQFLCRMQGQLSLLCLLLKSEDQAGLHVSFPEGMVSCKPGQGLGNLPQNFC